MRQHTSEVGEGLILGHGRAQGNHFTLTAHDDQQELLRTNSAGESDSVFHCRASSQNHLSVGESHIALWSRSDAGATLVTVAAGSGEVVTTGLTSMRCARISTSSDVFFTTREFNEQLEICSISPASPNFRTHLRLKQGTRSGDASPQVSANGDIMFLADSGGVTELRLRRNGEPADLRLVRGFRNAEPSAFAWSPTGRHVALSVDRPMGNELRLLDLSSGTMEVLAFEGVTPAFAWSTDGLRLAICRSVGSEHQLIVLNLMKRSKGVYDQTGQDNFRLPLWSSSNRLDCLSGDTILTFNLDHGAAQLKPILETSAL